MSSIKIKYDELEESSKYAKKLANELDDYANRITKKITSPVDSLPGNDKRGYASNIVSYASSKIRELNNRSNMFNTYSSSVAKFVSDAQTADKTVESSIKNTAKGYVGERSPWQAFCDNVYNFLFVECANSCDFLRMLKDVVVAGWSYVTSFTEKAIDWFKHGAGQYVWNIVSAVVAFVGAIAGAVTAVAAVIAGGPILAVVLAVIAAGAAIVGAIITTINSGIKFYNNVKALQNEDDPGVARYLGTIDGVSDAVEKYDMGDAEDNKKWETAGDHIDKTKAVCDVIGIVKGITDLGAIKDSATGVIKSYKFDKKNVMYNIRKSMGFKFKTNSKTIGQYTSKSQLGSKSDWDVTKSWFANKKGYGGFEWLNNRSKTTKTVIKSVFNTSNVIDKAQGTIKKVDSIYERLKTGFDFSSTQATLESIQSAGYAVIETYEALGNIKFMKGINGITVKPFRQLEKLVEAF